MPGSTTRPRSGRRWPTSASPPMPNWKLERMAVVDRNILRLGVFEFHYCDDIPATVTINEMVELAKQFGAAETPALASRCRPSGAG